MVSNRPTSDPTDDDPRARTQIPGDGPDGAEPRTGYVALVGRPNAGKSTLMNALVGERLSIVTPRAQTTWTRVTGILTQDDCQMIFLDTPGLLRVRDLHQKAMLASAHEALREADVTLLLVDADRPLSPADEEIVREALAESSAPLVVALNKADLVPSERLDRLEMDYAARFSGPVLRISAQRGDGLAELVEALRDRLPAGPFLYPADELASQPVRFFVAEMVRETVFEHYKEEVPYSVMAQVVDFREAEDPIYIEVHLYVERKSQKGIVIGQGGQAIRSLGAAARRKIETFLGRRVYLQLWVKPLAGWRRSRGHLARLGFRIPSDDS